VREEEMIKKNYTKTGKLCRVTFNLPPEVNAKKAFLCGEFNDWSTHSHPMKRHLDGGFSTTVTLPVGREYRFRYLLDGQRWENAWQADAYLPNEFGTEDSVIRV
jgi:1,4-alpha-glucan branching enzyme